MLLAIDAGNTNVVFALVEGDEIKARWRIATDPRRTADEYAVWLHQLLELEGYGRGDVKSVIVGTVVPRARPPRNRYGHGMARCLPQFRHRPWPPQRRVGPAGDYKGMASKS